MKIELFKRIYNQENLYWAWCKVKAHYEYQENFIVDYKELIDFEVSLDANLYELSEAVKNKKYKMSLLKPLSMPKKLDEENKPQARQNFHFSLRDQIIWVAIINVIGPILDNEMPFWSFGHRLYAPFWKDDKGKFKVGRYSLSNTKIYRSWNTSWPLFRKSIYITIKNMVDSKGDLTNEEEEYLNALSETPDNMKIKYWEDSFFLENDQKKIYYAQIDFTKFYPTIPKSLIKDNIMEYVAKSSLFNNQSNDIEWLINTMLDFKISETDIENCIDKFDDTNIDLPNSKDSVVPFNALPTGLIVSGFLSNISLLKLDKEISKRILHSKKIAHFRYVDDHVFLSQNFDELVLWIEKYKKLLDSHIKGVVINDSKTLPDKMKDYLVEKQKEENVNLKKLREDAERKCSINHMMPIPFLTMTLQRISDINKSSILFFDETEKKEMINELERMVAVEIPDEEIKKETRISWAATKLINLIKTVEFDVEEINFKKAKLENKHYEKLKLKEKYCEDECNNEKCNVLGEKFNTRDKDIQKNIDELKNDFYKAFNKSLTLEHNLHTRIFRLLLSSVEENICKPIVWKKLIIFCKSTGYDGYLEILRLLNESTELSDEAKVYIFATIIHTSTNSVIDSLKTINNVYSSTLDFEHAKKYLKLICSKDIIDLLKNEYDKYDRTFYVKAIFEMLLSIIKIISYEISKSKFEDEKYYFNNMYKAEYATIDNYGIWYVSNKYYMQDKPEKLHCMDFCSQNSKLGKKLIRMHEHTNNIDVENNNTIYSVFKSLKSRAVEQNLKYQDCRTSEWTCLSIILEIIDLIDPKEQELSFDKIHNENIKFITPNNFAFSEKIAEIFLDKKFKSYKEINEIFKTENKIYYVDTPIDDFRYSEDTYIDSRVTNNNKKQVFSIGALLLNLISNDFEFHPLINRKSKIDKSYHWLLSKLNYCYCSSYTRAIIHACLTFKTYEKRYLSAFDKVIQGRNDDEATFPLEIKNLQDLKKHITKAKEVLVKLQLNLDETTSFQLVPLSFKTISNASNPFKEKGE